ncbi:MAG: chorismate-binding protein [Winogradskyella sp.]|uniref:chorismate-binding protein n=1 Tax=Winogradskyella sp. TaxID=1883156 RepID=UPI00180365AC|nr:chorismate-binding protein [Winogradskyella sp.]
MDVNSFFEKLHTHYNNKLPFVVYSRPINSIISCWLQRNDKLHITKDFSESGFVFAPFDLHDNAIVFPEQFCQYDKVHTEELKIDKRILVNTKAPDLAAKPTHINLVAKGIDSIKKGQLDKVVLSRKVSKDTNIKNPIEIFKRLFNTYKNAMVYCWYHPKVGLWLGATPELLFKIEGKQLTSISLAGTQPFNNTDAFKWSSKEIEEQQIVTNYLVKKIEPFTSLIKISDLETVRAGNLLHLKSRITSTIKSATSLKTIIEALHPTPAVCGFPKDVAKEFILKHENYTREYYTGFLGELNLKQTKTRNTNKRNVENNAYAVVKKQSNFYVNLRCFQVKSEEAIIYVGGGITRDSIAENEWEETVNKTKTILDVLD